MFEVYNTFTDVVIATCPISSFAIAVCSALNDRYGSQSEYTSLWTYAVRECEK